MNIINRSLFLKCFSIILKNVSTHSCRISTNFIKFQKNHSTKVISVVTGDITSEIKDEFDDIREPVDIEAIVGDDSEKIKTMKYIILEIDICKQSGQWLVPEKITTEQWRELLNMENSRKREHYLKYLYIKEKRKMLMKINKIKKHEMYIEAKEKRSGMEKIEKTTNSPMLYNLSNVTLFNRILDSRIFLFGHYKIALAMMFGPHIVIDCSYEELMTLTELSHCIHQISYMWSSNRLAANPFNMILCNLNIQSEFMKQLHQVIPTIQKPDCFLNFTEKHYLDLFPKEKLVYLTPHCKNELVKYNHDDVYIIGAFVDEKRDIPASLAKAKRDGLRVTKFPLDKYLYWYKGSQHLPLNQVLSIMNDLKDGASWQYALRHIPIRKQKCCVFDNDMKAKKNDRLLLTYIREQNRQDILFNSKTFRISEKYDTNKTSGEQ